MRVESLGSESERVCERLGLTCTSVGLFLAPGITGVCRSSLGTVGTRRYSASCSTMFAAAWIFRGIN